MSKQTQFLLMSIIGLLFLIGVPTANAGGSGAIWTTEGSCGDDQQNENHYNVGDEIFINGSGFDPNTEYEWFIEGKPGGASCDPNIKVAEGTYTTDENGDFCFSAYIVQNNDCGEYGVDFDGKKDNYRVNDSPSLDIEKLTNDVDADEPTGPEVMEGDPVVWKYVVTNTGNTVLTDIVVTDDQIGEIGVIEELEPGESATLEYEGVAVVGQYANVGTASTTFNRETIDDSDPSHYLGIERPAPALDIEKATNGQDADEPTGPNITEGDEVTWTFVVTNTGNVKLTNILVTDDKLGNVGTIDELAPDESETLTLTGVATLGQYRNEATASTTFNDQTVEDSDLSHYYGVQGAAPSLKIEKATNGQDADEAPGPEIVEGSDVTWTYVVTNTGNVTLTNIVVTDDQIGQIGIIEELEPGQSETLEYEGVAVAGQYGNVGTACGYYTGQDNGQVVDSTPLPGLPVCDEDPSHYFGVRAQLDLEKSTNGVDADEEPGVVVTVGDPVVWEYVVTNTGNVPLSNITVEDDKIGTVCTIESLGVGEQAICSVTGTAVEGQYGNLGTACGYYTGQENEEEEVAATQQPGLQACDEDPSHYFGSERKIPSIDIEKLTNGEEADEMPGPLVQEGSTVTWTYIVTNTGNVPLSNVTIVDDVIGEICSFESLAVGESQTCETTGPAQLGQYENIGLATGWFEDEKVSDSDTSHYVGEKWQDTEPDDFAVCISFKDRDGNYVGDVLAYLSIPGEQDWKVLSSWTEILAGGMWPCNALFRNYTYVVGGTYEFKFHAPTGWKFVSPDHMELEVPAGEGFYSVSGNNFILERTTVQNTSSIILPDQPLPTNLAPEQLLFVQGSPTSKGEGWDNAVDGDYEGWDGTTTAKRDAANNTPTYAIFKFAGNDLYQFNRLMIQTDNGADDDKWSLRQVSLIDVQVSTKGVNPEDFASIKQVKINKSELTSIKLGQTVQAKYIKLLLLQPESNPWMQIVEFNVGTSSKNSAEPASEGVQISAVPMEYALDQNYPNPFNPVTTISYNLPADAQVKLTIFDITGKEVATLADEFQSKGSYSVQWNANGNSSGLYFYKISAGSFNKTLRMVLLK